MNIILTFLNVAESTLSTSISQFQDFSIEHRDDFRHPLKAYDSYKVLYGSIHSDHLQGLVSILERSITDKKSSVGCVFKDDRKNEVYVYNLKVKENVQVKDKDHLINDRLFAAHVDLSKLESIPQSVEILVNAKRQLELDLYDTEDRTVTNVYLYSRS